MGHAGGQSGQGLAQRAVSGSALPRPCRIPVSLVHGLRISRPSFERDTHGLSLPVGNHERSSFSAHGSESSLPSCRQSRTVLTFRTSRQELLKHVGAQGVCAFRELARFPQRLAYSDVVQELEKRTLSR
jgi:hypothetical protein